MDKNEAAAESNTQSRENAERVKKLQEEVEKVTQTSTVMDGDVKKLQEFQREYEKHSQGKVFVSEDKVDAKMQKVLESLKSNNELVWKESLALAE